MTDFSETEALRRVTEVWRWAAKRKPYFAFLLGAAILAFEMDRGAGKFEPPGATKGIQTESTPKRPRRGRPPKRRG